MPTTHRNNFPKLHNAAWPGVVGKGSAGVFAEAAEAARNVLSSSTIADVAEAEARAAGAAMYHI